MEKKLYFKVEYDLSYSGGNYDQVGEFALIPVESVYAKESTGMTFEDALTEAFTELTDVSFEHIVYYSEEVVEENGRAYIE